MDRIEPAKRVNQRILRLSLVCSHADEVDMARIRGRVERSRDVGDRMVGDGVDRVWRPFGRLSGRASLGGLGRSASEVLEDAPHHARVVDQRVHAHGSFAFGTNPGIGFVDFADEPRPQGRVGPLPHPSALVRVANSLRATSAAGSVFAVDAP